MLAEFLSTLSVSTSQLAAYYADPVTAVPALASALGCRTYAAACLRSSVSR